MTKQNNKKIQKTQEINIIRLHPWQELIGEIEHVEQNQGELKITLSAKKYFQINILDSKIRNKLQDINFDEGNKIAILRTDSDFIIKDSSQS